MARHRLIPLTLALLATCGLAAGCTKAASTMDREKTERAILASVAKKTIAPATSVSCPSSIERKVGTSFECVAKVEGDRRLRLKVDVGKKDTLRVDVLDTVIDPVKVGASVDDALTKKYGRAFSVDCGDAGPTVVAVGKELGCTAKDDTSKRMVKVTVADAAASLDIDVG